MSIDTLARVLLWSGILNYAVLILWVILLVAARGWTQAVANRLFGLSKEQSNAIQYAGIMFYKVGIFLFNFGPYLAIRFFV